VVVRFDFRGVPTTTRSPKTFWLVLTRRDVDLCLRDPGFDLDLVVEADLAALTRVWMGDVGLGAMLHAGLIRLEGPSALARAFPRWLALSSFARTERPHALAAS
jgi:hypothetical protein